MNERDLQLEEVGRLTGLLLAGALDDTGRRRLEESLLADPDAMEYYQDYVDVHCLLHWQHGLSEEQESHELGARTVAKSLVGAAAEQSSRVNYEIDLAVSTSLPTTHYPLSTNFVGGPVFSYMVATVVLCAMLLGAWAYKITISTGEYAGGRHRIDANDTAEFVVVGRVTGMTADCRWTDPNSAAIIGSAVSKGRCYSLAAGLFEITYDCGAKVILEGPCDYTADSITGGRLQSGKLVARVEKRGEKEVASGQWLVASAKPQAANPRSPAPSPSPLFSIRTPTAIVTDLGTEFGVEVNANGDTTSHVFRGSVKMRAIGKGKQEVVLEKNESARVGSGTDRIAVIHREADHQEQFVRWMPRQAPIVLFNTGAGLKEGDSDPHWQLVAASNDPKFKPQSAVVISVIPAWYLRNDPARSQWISTCWHAPPPGIMYMPALPHNVTYTFRTTFDLTNAILESVVLRGQFIADSRVSAIRLNGTALPIPEHGDVSPFNDFHSFVIREEFVEGTNVLEFDVFSGYPMDKNSKINFMAFRVELNGFVLQDQCDHSVKKESGR